MPHTRQLSRCLPPRHLPHRIYPTTETPRLGRPNQILFIATVWMIEQITTDILILGTGGAGLMAALHAHWRDPKVDVTLVSKGLLGKSGCTRMVQGGYNVVLNPNDSVQAHFEDTVKGGGFINDQDLAWTLVNDAPRIVLELENKIGCLFDRSADGRIHQKAFAGQTFDRTVHKGDLTGIEIMARLRDQVLRARIRCLQETRGLELLTTD